MATVILGAAGAAIGGAVGGTVMGVSAAAIGRYVGASIGHRIDQRLMGSSHSYSVDTGKIDAIALTTAGEGHPIARVFGRMRVNAHVIWASQVQENVTTETQTTGGGGKGGGAPKSTVTQEVHTYSLSFAVGLCEGEISGIGRIWANGQEIAHDKISYTLYSGGPDQMPDPLIAAQESCAPAFHGLAYLVFEDLDLTQFGNRLPQLAIEVIGKAEPQVPQSQEELAHLIPAVAMIPGSGEYALSTKPAYLDKGNGEKAAANINSPTGKADILTSLDQLMVEAPKAKATSLVVSWFGDDLRCGECRIEPRVERKTGGDAQDHPWQVAGQLRQDARVVPYDENGAPLYGGTPTDRSVKEAIQALRAAGQEVMFYPFIMMTQKSGNGLEDPWTGAADQPHLPWRGRITTSQAPNRPQSPDGTAAAGDEVARFFGKGANARYWNYSRFILHYAKLCQEAGGVEAFCIGSEMRGLTQIRDETGFPAVDAFIDLAQKVRDILGPSCKIGYAADWSEYWGYTPTDGSGDRYFHLDPLWADQNIDFIGIDNYMPISDWRNGDVPNPDGESYDSVYNLDYLRANIEGGEGYDWYYASDADRQSATRTPINDAYHGEPWIWRYKDMRSWWNSAHYERLNGERVKFPTPWEPQSKPIWFTELGCAALNNAANQPNVFMDPKSSESAPPYFSDGSIDEFMQMRFLQAVLGYWQDPERNPRSQVYDAPMIDMGHIFIWAWDARPYPWFPNQSSVWSDGGNYASGHWITGRASARSLASVIAEICFDAGITNYDVSGVYGAVAGYSPGPSDTPRGALQSLMLAYGVDSFERGGKIVFAMRGAGKTHVIDPLRVVVENDVTTGIERTRASSSSLIDTARFGFIVQGEDFTPVVEEAHHSTATGDRVEGTELRLLLPRGQGRAIAERWLAESHLARETLRFALPPSDQQILAGDLVSFEDRPHEKWRIDQREILGALEFEATRCDPAVYETQTIAGVEAAQQTRLATPVPLNINVLDLPLLRQNADPVAPYVSADVKPWPSSVAIYASAEDAGYRFARNIAQKATQGYLTAPLKALVPSVQHRAASCSVWVSGALTSISWAAFAKGQNAAALWHEAQGEWEIIQFQTAQLQEGGSYTLGGLVRGVRGTDHLAGYDMEAGARFVLLDGALAQLPDEGLERDERRFLRIGPAAQNYDHPSYVLREVTCQAIGLRPFGVVHLSAKDQNGALRLTWQRQTRWGGESWSGLDVPLFEDKEQYVLRFLNGDEVVEEVFCIEPLYDVSESIRAAATSVEVAQLSQAYGSGVPRRLDLQAVS